VAKRRARTGRGGARGAGAGRRCAVAGCGRFVGKGKVVCPDHGRGGEGRAVSGAIGRLARGIEDAAAAGAGLGEGRARFARAVARGEFGELFGGRLREVLAGAAAERGLTEELGALRVALVRLLSEEEDAGKLALGVARLAHATARLRREERALAEAGGVAEWDAVVAQVLAELDAEQEQQQERESAFPPAWEYQPLGEKAPRGWNPRAEPTKSFQD